MVYYLISVQKYLHVIVSRIIQKVVKVHQPRELKAHVSIAGEYKGGKQCAHSAEPLIALHVASIGANCPPREHIPAKHSTILAREAWNHQHHQTNS